MNGGPSPSRNFWRGAVFYSTGGAATAKMKAWRRVRSSDEEFQMASIMTKQWLAAPVAALLLLGASNGAQAKGCIKGAAVGAVAGHFARHHAVLGAAAGCVVGHHMAKKKEREERAQRREQRREAQRTST